MMDIEKLIEQLNNLEACAYSYHINGEVLGMDCSDFEQLMVDAVEEISKISMLQAENEKLRAELDLKDKVVELAHRTKQEAEAEINLLAHCVYYKRGGMCRYGGDDPANVCGFGPCPHEKSAKDVLADLSHVTAERDAAVEQLHGICSACKNYSPYHNTGKCGFCVYEQAREKDVEANDNWQWSGPKKEDWHETADCF